MSLVSTESRLKRLEKQLKQKTDQKQRLFLINELVGQYAYTNINRAQSLLGEFRQIAELLDDRDYLLNFHLYSALIENQLYNYNLAAFHYQQAFEILNERGDVRQQAEAFIDYAGVCINQERLEEATTMLDKSEKLLEVFPDAQLTARAKCREGYINLQYSNYTKAIEQFLEAEKGIDVQGRELEMKDYYFLSLISAGLGRVYQMNGNVDKSVKAYLKAVRICESLEIRSRLCWHFVNLGSVFMNMSDDESANEYFRKALKITDDISRDARAAAYANLGNIAFRRRSFDEALELYNQAEYLYKKRSKEDLTNLSVIANWKGRLFAALGKEGKAENHFYDAFKLAQKQKDFKQLSSVCKDIAHFYARQEDFVNAYEYQVLHDQMLERYHQEVNRRTMAELEVKYDAEKRKQEAEMLRLQAVNLQLKALRSQMNPHFMFNALNSIQHYMTDNVEAAKNYLAKFAHLMRQSLENSDNEVISLEKEIEFLKDYLYIHQKLRYDSQLDYEIFVDEEIEEDIMGVPTMILQPIIENAIEHGVRLRKLGKIRLEFFLKDEATIRCIVQDNGIGREKAREFRTAHLEESGVQHQSKATSIIKQRLDILAKFYRREIFYETKDLMRPDGEAAGTRVELHIPIRIIQK